MPTGSAANIVPFRSRDTAAEFGGAITRSRSETVDAEGAPVMISSPQALPSAAQIIPLQDLGNGLCFIHPLFVVLDQIDSDFTATSVDLALTGRGTSSFEAVDDLRDQLAELYESLTELRDRLGPYLQRQLAFLDKLAGAR